MKGDPLMVCVVITWSSSSTWMSSTADTIWVPCKAHQPCSLVYSMYEIWLMYYYMWFYNFKYWISREYSSFPKGWNICIQPLARHLLKGRQLERQNHQIQSGQNFKSMTLTVGGRVYWPLELLRKVTEQNYSNMDEWRITLNEVWHNGITLHCQRDCHTNTHHTETLAPRPQVIQTWQYWSWVLHQPTTTSDFIDTWVSWWGAILPPSGTTAERMSQLGKDFNMDKNTLTLWHPLGSGLLNQV